MVYASNALVIKPAASLSPMIVAAILSRCGYDEVKAGTATAAQKLYLQNTIFTFSCFAPIVIGIIQIIAWRQYKLRGEGNSQERTITVKPVAASSART